MCAPPFFHVLQGGKAGKPLHFSVRYAILYHGVVNPRCHCPQGKAILTGGHATMLKE